MFNNVSHGSNAPYRAQAAMSARRNTPPLPPAVQEHLGQMLRADYYERSEKPRYLGDPALPLEFDPYLYRLEQKERALRITRIREQGAQAVAEALSGLNF